MDNNSTTFRERLKRTSPVMEPLKTQVGGDHYKGKAIQPVEFIHANDIGFMAGNAIKYLTRYREKGGEQDVRKALHYCRLILALEYGANE